jgi:hypothetical protein
MEAWEKILLTENKKIRVMVTFFNADIFQSKI